MEVYIENAKTYEHVDFICNLIKVILFTYVTHHYNRNIVDTLKIDFSKNYALQKQNNEEIPYYIYYPKNNKLTFSEPFQQFESIEILNQQNTRDVNKILDESIFEEDQDFTLADNFEFLMRNIQVDKKKDNRIVKIFNLEEEFVREKNGHLNANNLDILHY